MNPTATDEVWGYIIKNSDEEHVVAQVSRELDCHYETVKHRFEAMVQMGLAERVENESLTFQYTAD